MLKRQWTFADLEDLPEDGNRYEIIDGELFVTPACSTNESPSTNSPERVAKDEVRLTVEPANGAV